MEGKGNPTYTWELFLFIRFTQIMIKSKFCMVPLVCRSQSKLKGIKGQKPVILIVKKELSVYSGTHSLKDYFRTMQAKRKQDLPYLLV